MVESKMMKRGEFTQCWQSALKQSGVKVVENITATCTDCPLMSTYSGRAGMAVRLEYDVRVYGIISVSIPVKMAVDADEQSLFNEVVNDIAYGFTGIILQGLAGELNYEQKIRKYLEVLK